MTISSKPLLLTLAVILQIAVVGLLYLALIRQKPALRSPGQAGTPATGTTVSPKPVGVPVKFAIQSLGVTASVVQVGINGDGQMEVPTNWVDVGWYKLGPRPGELGNAVLAGHLDGPKGEHGVFWDLNKIAVGAAVDVTDDHSRVYHYSVKRTESVKADLNVLSGIFGSSQNFNLNLITCTGPWDKNNQQFSQRLIVYTELVQ